MTSFLLYYKFQKYRKLVRSLKLEKIKGSTQHENENWLQIYATQFNTGKSKYVIFYEFGQKMPKFCASQSH